MKKRINRRRPHLRATYRSGLEEQASKQLMDSGLSFAYEGELNTIKYIVPESKHKYLADFLLANGIIIETKGLFVSADRKKHLLIKEQYPILDIRFVFSNVKNRIYKKSKTTYGDWCKHHGFKYANKLIPGSWLKEKKPNHELNEIIRLLESFKANKTKSLADRGRSYGTTKRRLHIPNPTNKKRKTPPV